MGRWWTGYTSISAGRLGIAHSHGKPWLFAATERLHPAYGYGLWKAKIPSEKMCSIAVCGGAGCELEDVMPPPSRSLTRPAVPATGCWPDVLDVHLMAPLLTVSADIVYDLLQRGDLLGRKVGRKWLTTKTAVLKWLEQSATPHPTAAQETALAHAIAHGDTAALVDAVCTGKARLGTKVQHAARSGRVPGGDQAWAVYLHSADKYHRHIRHPS